MRSALLRFAPKFAAMGAAMGLICCAGMAQAEEFKILQPLGDKPMAVKKTADTAAGYYLPSTVETILWGSLPNAESKPVLTVPSGSVVTVDTVSHEGILEDQGRDPVKFFGQYGVKPDQVLNDAKA